MLTPAEALLFQAVKDEQAREEATQIGGALGAVGGALGGAAIGSIPNSIGNAINNLKGVQQKSIARSLKPGYRMAGGLTGMILAGGLGAGTAALMKKESPAAQLLGKIQAQGGEMDNLDQDQLERLLGDVYNTPSQFM